MKQSYDGSPAGYISVQAPPQQQQYMVQQQPQQYHQQPQQYQQQQSQQYQQQPQAYMVQQQPQQMPQPMVYIAQAPMAYVAVPVAFFPGQEEKPSYLNFDEFTPVPEKWTKYVIFYQISLLSFPFFATQSWLLCLQRLF
jgi:hypothetical protein